MFQTFRNYHNRCYHQFERDGFYNQEYYNITDPNVKRFLAIMAYFPKQPCGFARGYWFFYAITFTLTSGTLSSRTFFYDTTRHANFNQKSAFSWTGPTNYSTVSFTSNDYILIRDSFNHPPAIDTTFSGVFVTPHYILDLNIYYFYFGNYRGNLGQFFVFLMQNPFF